MGRFETTALAALLAWAGLLESSASADPVKHAQQPLTGSLCKADANCALFRIASDALPASGIQMANGYLARPQDWSAVIMAHFSYGKDAEGKPIYATCTATLVGIHVLLTAAHCIDMGESDRYRPALFVVDNRNVKISCDPDPRYFREAYRGESPRSSYDFALCELSWQGLTPPTLQKLVFEMIDARTPLVVGAPVLMTGYGCTDLRVENHRLRFTPDATKFRVGEEAIWQATSGGGAEAAYVVARSEGGKQPELCPGDSGGPLLSGLRLIKPATPDGVATLKSSGPRRIRGVNSSIDFIDRPAPPYDFVSRIAAFAGTGFDAYATWWRGRHPNAKLCGISPDASQCQD